MYVYCFELHSAVMCKIAYLSVVDTIPQTILPCTKKHASFISFMPFPLSLPPSPPPSLRTPHPLSLSSSFLNHKLTCTILGVLRFNVNGLPYFNFEGENILLWPLGAAITDIRTAGPLSAYSNESLMISGEENPVIL